MDEIWTFVAKKEKRMRVHDIPGEVGDQYVFVAMDSGIRLVPVFWVGKQNAGVAWHFVQDLKWRLANRVHLTSDGFRSYINAVADAFGIDVGYAMLIKTYSETG